MIFSANGPISLYHPDCLESLHLREVGFQMLERLINPV